MVAGWPTTRIPFGANDVPAGVNAGTVGPKRLGRRPPCLVAARGASRRPVPSGQVELQKTTTKNNYKKYKNNYKKKYTNNYKKVESRE